MSNTPFNNGAKDAQDGKLAADMRNAPAPVREQYHAGYAHSQQQRDQQNKN